MRNSMNTLDEKYSTTGVMLLRISLGIVWIAHALLKWFVFTIPGFASWLESQGLPGFMAWPVFLMEIVGGLMILTGYYGRYVSIALVPILLVAVFTHLPNGWVHTNTGGGWEFPMFLVLASLAHVLIGDGRFALRSKQNLLSV